MLIDQPTWQNDFYGDFNFRDGSHRVPKSAIAQFADNPTNLFRQFIQGGEGMGQWQSAMDNTYRMFSTPDAAGRLRYGTNIQGFAPNTPEGGTADAMINGVPRLRYGGSYDEAVQMFQRNGMPVPASLRPEAFQYDDAYGYHVDPQLALEWGQPFMDKAKANNSPKQGVALVGGAMGLANLAAMGLAGTSFAPTDFQSLFSSLSQNAASQGGGWSDIFGGGGSDSLIGNPGGDTFDAVQTDGGGFEVPGMPGTTQPGSFPVGTPTFPGVGNGFSPAPAGMPAATLPGALPAGTAAFPGVGSAFANGGGSTAGSVWDILSKGVGIASGVAGIAGSVGAAGAARDASGIQSGAANSAIAEQRRQFDTIVSLLSPFTQAGTKAIGAQQDLVGLGGPGAQQAAITALEGSPMFTSLVKQGENAMLQNASATGGLRGGNIQGALRDFRPRVLAQLINDQFSKLGGITGVGQASAAGQANAAMNTGTNVGRLMLDEGAARAGGELAEGQTISNIARALAGLSGIVGTF
jgi:hypothetical protein